MIQEIKRGADFVTPEGEVIPNARLTRPAVAPKRYAYCSDTAFHPSIIPIIEGVDLLYHEATFADVTPHVRKRPSTLPPAKRPRLLIKPK